jgi:hypothetical protein
MPLNPAASRVCILSALQRNARCLASTVRRSQRCNHAWAELHATWAARLACSSGTPYLPLPYLTSVRVYLGVFKYRARQSLTSLSQCDYAGWCASQTNALPVECRASAHSGLRQGHSHAKYRTRGHPNCHITARLWTQMTVPGRTGRRCMSVSILTQKPLLATSYRCARPVYLWSRCQPHVWYEITERMYLCILYVTVNSLSMVGWRGWHRSATSTSGAFVSKTP